MNMHIPYRFTRQLMAGLLLLLPILASAGEFFGTIKKDGKPLANQEITIVQNGKVIGTTKTDEKGYYSVVVKPFGKCTLEIPGFEGAVFEVFSTNNSTEYTLSLVKDGEKWTLRKQ